MTNHQRVVTFQELEPAQELVRAINQKDDRYRIQVRDGRFDVIVRSAR